MNCIAGLPGVKEIILLHVIESGHFHPNTVREAQINQARENIEANRIFLLRLGLENVKTIIITGESIPGGIVSAAENEEVSIIVMEPKSRGFIDGLHLGSISLRVIHDTSKNLLILRSQLIEGLQGKQYQRFCSFIFSKVLVSTDLSPESLKVVHEIASVPGINELIVCYCLPLGTLESEMITVREVALEKIETTCREIVPSNVLFRVRILAGDPVGEIEDYAHESDISLLCCIRHGKTTIDEMIHGSFTCALASRGHHPILIYKDGQVS